MLYNHPTVSQYQNNSMMFSSNHLRCVLLSFWSLKPNALNTTGMGRIPLTRLPKTQILTRYKNEMLCNDTFYACPTYLCLSTSNLLVWEAPGKIWLLKAEGLPCQIGVSLNTLRLRQNGRRLPDDIFKCIFMNENVQIAISLKFVPKGPINNIPALVQIMAWRRPGDKPLSEPMMACFVDEYMHHPASMS